ncbi:MAG: hypothetical protein IJ939_01155 [Clostridia bacterium]|nr:hypothetical protein [Clostridia bacterium]
MFDLHSHVLPFVDDGAKDIEMSLAMLKTAKEQGVELVAATPHCMPKDWESIDAVVEKRNAEYKKMNELISDKNEYPRLVYGTEVHLCKDISEYEELSSLCYCNTNYILLEMPRDNMPSKIAEWVYNVCIKGYRPVIAHIDRYSFYSEIMDELSHLDVVYQVNAARFLTMSDRRLLRKIFRKHDKFIVSTDMHNLTTRTCNMGKARAVAEKKFPEMCDMLFESGAKAILNNESFPAC